MQVNIDIYESGSIRRVATSVSVTNNILANVLPVTLCCAEIWAISTCGGINLTGYPVSVCARTLNATPDVVANLVAPAELIGYRSFGVTWDPPLNFNSTPGVTYNITVMNRGVFTLVDATYINIDNLDPCVTYAVEVSAYIPQVGPPTDTRSLSVKTRAALPPPPTEVRASINQGLMLTITWNLPSQMNCNQSIDNFRLYWSCNGFMMNQTRVPSTMTTTTVDVSASNVALGWCIAQFQSCDTEGRCGDFSNQARVSLPRLAPTVPICFLQTEAASNVTFSFTITEPFVTDDLMVSWLLRSDSHNVDDSYRYSDSRRSHVTVAVNRNTEYEFQLQLCNAYGCSPACTRSFTTIVSLVN